MSLLSNIAKHFRHSRLKERIEWFSMMFLLALIWAAVGIPLAGIYTFFSGWSTTAAAAFSLYLPVMIAIVALMMFVGWILYKPRKEYVYLTFPAAGIIWILLPIMINTLVLYLKIFEVNNECTTVLYNARFASLGVFPITILGILVIWGAIENAILNRKNKSQPVT
jgi:hypothetical protein